MTNNTTEIPEISEKKFNEMINTAYCTIGDAIFPQSVDSNSSRILQVTTVMAGTNALFMALTAAVGSLTKAGLIPADLGLSLMEQSRRLSQDVRKAIDAQVTMAAMENAPDSKKELH